MKKSKKLPQLLIVLISIYLLIPFVVTFIYSLSTEWVGIIPSGFTVKNYVELFQDMDFWLSVGRTLVICVVSVSISIALLLGVMFVVTMYAPWLGKYIQFICMIPYALQGVILSISIVSLFSGTGTFLSNRMMMLFGAYSIMVLPYIYQGIRNNLNAINSKMLVDAAQMLGAGRLYAIFRVVIPNIMSGVIVSSLLAVSIVFGDFVLANNIAGNNYQNIQVYLYVNMTKSSSKASAIVVLIFVVVFGITGTVLWLQNRGKKVAGR